MEHAIYWWRGSRVVNQDSCMLHRIFYGRTEIVVAAVADGIGGLSEGEQASGFCLEQLMEWVYEEGAMLLSKKREYLVKSIERCIYGIESQLEQYGKAVGRHLGTTIAGAIIWKGPFSKRYRMMSFYLGDSRIYVKKRKRWIVVNQNHCAPDGRLNRCIGSMEKHMPFCSFDKLRSGQAVFLCTDGIYKGIEHQVIEEAFREVRNLSSEQLKKRLLGVAKKAERKGSEDNQTGILLVL